MHQYIGLRDQTMIPIAYSPLLDIPLEEDIQELLHDQISSSTIGDIKYEFPVRNCTSHNRKVVKLGKYAATQKPIIMDLERRTYPLAK
ncbi:unnamed protein product [Ceutorhynchus assimilis]|uniref:Uncharacterized protein n=1 Tax=Ceutorhynchus assimilis TaxID=467358 RepID=A0A9N9MDQ2_9CUCU|nr:unnamed protein product [Ceutorhynchus assimilis]